MTVPAISAYSPAQKTLATPAEETKSSQVNKAAINFDGAANSTNDTVSLSKDELTLHQNFALALAKDQLGKFFDVAINKDGRLIVTANHNKSFLGGTPLRLLGAIKRDLALDDGVILKNNEALNDINSPKFERFDERPSLLDMASLREGCSIQIPIDEIGKAPTWWQKLCATFDDYNETRE